MAGDVLTIPIKGTATNRPIRPKEGRTLVPPQTAFDVFVAGEEDGDAQ